jgi:hypothetical protein
MGKEILEAQRKEDDMRLKRIAEERQREKDEDARARWVYGHERCKHLHIAAMAPNLQKVDCKWRL